MSIKEHEAAILREALDRNTVDTMMLEGTGIDEPVGLLYDRDILDLAGDPLDWPLEERPMAYLAGYYTANPAQGIANAARWFQPLTDAGWLTVIPHVNILLDMLAPQTPNFWYRHDMGLLSRCDAIFICPDYLTAHSTGVLNEIAFATKHEIPVFYDVILAKDRYAL